MKTFPLQSLTLAQAQQSSLRWWIRSAVTFLVLIFWPVVIWDWLRG